MKLTIPIKLDEGAIVPFYGSKGAACFDIVAKSINYLPSTEIMVVHTGLYFAIPEGYKLTVQPRSSFTGCDWVLQNSPAQIDSDYRGELILKFKQFGTGNFPYKEGERCAQGAIEEVIQANFQVVSNLSQTDRGTGGFGSTGLK